VPRSTSDFKALARSRDVKLCGVALAVMLLCGSVTLIETPWRLESHFNALSLYQDTHRQKVNIAFVTPV
jgi:hypothetical protein